jgi:regulatory protein
VDIMPIITKISSQIKNSERYNVFLDEKYAFSVDEEVLIRFQLTKGKEMNEMDLSEVQFSDDIRKAVQLAIQYLGIRMRSEGELYAYLVKKEVEETFIPEVIEKMYHYKYLDDNEYAKAYVRTQVQTTDKGPTQIKRELKERFIQEQDMEEALLYYPKEAQIEKVLHLIEKLMKKYKKDSSSQAKQKVEASVMRKGYTWEVISIAFEERKEINVEYEEFDEFEDDPDLEAIKFQAEKLERKLGSSYDRTTIQKMKQALYRKGFKLDLIDQVLTKMQEESE